MDNQQSVGPMWVKASQRFPTKDGNYFLRHPYEDGRMHGWWAYIPIQAIDKEYWKKMEYEWLDENHEQQLIREQVFTREQVCEAIIAAGQYFETIHTRDEVIDFLKVYWSGPSKPQPHLEIDVSKLGDREKASILHAYDWSDEYKDTPLQRAGLRIMLESEQKRKPRPDSCKNVSNKGGASCCQ